jgi:hypothetical protein
MDNNLVVTTLSLEYQFAIKRKKTQLCFIQYISLLHHVLIDLIDQDNQIIVREYYANVCLIFELDEE